MAVTSKNYLFTSNGINFSLKLSSDYDGIKDAVGLKDMPNPQPDSLADESLPKLLRSGNAIKVSIGLENKKRRKIFMAANKSFHALVGKTFAGSTIKSASIATHVTYL
ncbi:MAG: hypothetical protein V7L00_27115 [Nostoc sp.]|uniref:hypothetical protein n=1 Tax=Nostoc sp. TaxID=1180 RepID=UPI002FFA27F5